MTPWFIPSKAKLLCLMILGTLPCWGCDFQPAGDARQSVGIGNKLERLELQPLTGDSQPLTLADLRGSVVLLNFWGTWCPPCRMELPHIAEIYQQRQEAKFKLLAVSCGESAAAEDIDSLREDTKALLESQQITMPTYADSAGVTRAAVARAANFDGYPTTVVLDGDGIIRGFWVGYAPGAEKEMQELIEQLLKQAGQL
jgi:thiol-disulfide isomerase/thioredoxin